MRAIPHLWAVVVDTRGNGVRASAVGCGGYVYKMMRARAKLLEIQGYYVHHENLRGNLEILTKDCT